MTAIFISTFILTFILTFIENFVNVFVDNCPNIMCFRCGSFGHHLRNCTNPRMSKPVLCTVCGSCSHDTRHCSYTWANTSALEAAIDQSTAPAGSGSGSGDGRGRGSVKHERELDRSDMKLMTQTFPRLDGPDARCIRCNKYGHLCCGMFPVLKERYV